MESLTGKQKRYLRSLGQRLHAEIAVGKTGVSETLRAHLDRLLDERELAKVRLGEGTTGGDRRRAAEELAAGVGAFCAGVVGRTALLYKPNESLPIEKRILLG
ncbi:MAG: YhbY family RNA-binding protein [Phycisphaerae bacterium]|nr:YhbY family RNA-binding protein [Phycisphaerae bacterium]